MAPYPDTWTRSRSRRTTTATRLPTARRRQFSMQQVYRPTPPVSNVVTWEQGHTISKPRFTTIMGQ